VRSVKLGVDELRDVLLVRAFEEGDAEGELLGRREREIASRESRAELASSGGEVAPLDFLRRRAERLRLRLERSQPAVTRVLQASAREGPPLWLVAGLGILLGIAVDRLGGGARINLLSFPILGLLAWNLAVYAYAFTRDLFAFRRDRRARSEGEASRAAAEGWTVRALRWILSPERPWRGAHAVKEARAEVAVCLQRFLRDWLRVGGPLHRARAELALHLGAACLMLGAVGGLYLRGLVFHYEASWESTFLTADAVQAFLRTCFAPAAWILGEPVPGVEELELLRAPQHAGPAARWIHYYAVTGGLFVVLPRALLACAAGLRARRLRRGLPLDLEGDAYFLRLLAHDRGQGQRAVVQPYSYHPNARSSEGLTTLLLDVLGGRTGVEHLEPCEYGDDPVPLSGEAGGPACHVILFNLAQSPELEVHGEYLARLAEEVEGAGAGASLLVVLDQGPFRERLGRGEEGSARLAERERSWGRVLDELGLEALACELDGLAEPAVLERARQLLQSPGGSGAPA